MRQFTLKGHKVAKGVAQGEALVSRSAITFMGGVDPRTGLVVERGHELEGKCLAGKVLVFPTGKGSTLGSYQLYELALNGRGPCAILNVRADPVVTVGAIMSDIPMMDRLDEDLFLLIQTGDLVEVDADKCLVTITKKGMNSYSRI